MERLKGCLGIAQDDRLTQTEKAITAEAERDETVAGMAAIQSLLVDVLDGAGWRGSGPGDDTGFYCEHCKEYDVDPNMIVHSDCCLITKTKAVLENLPTRAKALAELAEAALAETEAEKAASTLSVKTDDEEWERQQTKVQDARTKRRTKAAAYRDIGS